MGVADRRRSRSVSPTSSRSSLGGSAAAPPPSCPPRRAARPSDAPPRTRRSSSRGGEGDERDGRPGGGTTPDRRGAPPGAPRPPSSALRFAPTGGGRTDRDGLGPEALLSVGVIADVQYAPVPDGHSYGGVPRYYRHALSAARHAAEHFERDGADVLVNLGDMIDGKCQDVGKLNGRGGCADVDVDVDCDADADADAAPSKPNPGRVAMMDVLSALSAYTRGPTLHTYGNHELYNLNRDELSSLLRIPFVREPCGDLVGYHSRVVRNGVRFVVLDTYDVSTGGRCPDTSKKRREAEELLARHNPNFPENENSPEGMVGEDRRYVAFNGGVGRIQLDWLDETLRRAEDAGERVIVLSHQPILPGSTNPVCLVWNYDDVLGVLRRFPRTVMASFSGHAHRGGYRRDDVSGVHFRVFEAALESDHPVRTYGFVDVHEDRLVVRGMGDCASAVYDLDHMTVGQSEWASGRGGGTLVQTGAA